MGRRKYGRFAAGAMLLAAVLWLGGCGAQDDAAAGGTVSSTVQSGAAQDSAEAGSKTDAAAPQDSAAQSGTAQDDAVQDYAAVVTITINPQLELYVDDTNRVVDFKPMNDDAEAVFKTAELTDRELGEAVTLIVQTAADAGYLEDGGTVRADVAAKQGEQLADDTADTLLQTVRDAVQSGLSDKKLSAALEIAVSGEAKLSETLGASAEQTASSGQAASSEQAASSGQEASSGQPCQACGGTGICAECGGGTLPCKRCGGSLWESCGTCNGSGRQKCPGCNGSGTDATSGSACNHCGGAGFITCQQCGGSGGKACSICNGKGVISDDCILCHGAKTCTVCGGAGVQKQE